MLRRFQVSPSSREMATNTSGCAGALDLVQVGDHDGFGDVPRLDHIAVRVVVDHLGGDPVRRQGRDVDRHDLDLGLVAFHVGGLGDVFLHQVAGLLAGVEVLQGLLLGDGGQSDLAGAGGDRGVDQGADGGIIGEESSGGGIEGSSASALSRQAITGSVMLIAPWPGLPSASRLCSSQATLRTRSSSMSAPSKRSNGETRRSPRASPRYRLPTEKSTRSSGM